MANLVFYPYQLENGSYIDKISGKKLNMHGSISPYPKNITPYKTKKDYLGGGGIYKTSENRSSFIYGTGLLDKLYDFTIYFWGYNFMRVIFARDDTGGSTGFYINDYSVGFGGGPDISRRFYDSTTSNKWVFYEITFKRSGSNYIVSGFYQGIKKFTVTVSSGYINHTKFFIGTWSYSDAYYDNGMYGYVYDFSIYDEILHTENYNQFPIIEMSPTVYYKGMQKENNLYGMI